MNPKPPQPPNPVPEEDLNLHENFAPIIAENGLIRQPKAPEVSEESLPDFLTRLDTLQDLVALRHAEQAEQQKQQEKSLPPEGEDAQRADEGESLQAATTSLTVRQAQTTALVPVSKWTLARRLKLLKRKRQHKRRLAARAKKRAAQAVASKTVSKNQTPKRPNRWKWAWVILLLLFLGGLSSFVPVEKVPLLRELAYAMGFDKVATARMSFLRALLTWTDKTIGLPGNWSDEAGLWARGRADSTGTPAQESSVAGLNARTTREGAPTRLIDMQALNAMQRQKGYALDGVRGAVKLTPGQEEADLGPAVLRDDSVQAQTEANRNQGEVFFGSDNSAINRHFKDGYDSTKTLAKIKNPHIADGKPIDWLLNTTQQLMRTNSPLGGLNRQLEGMRVSWGDNIASLGEQKPHKDLYYAWITSRISNRTPNLMLKKSLVDVGFLGADMPTMASTALGGGVQIDSVSFQEDQEAWKEYLEWEKQCKKELGNQGASTRIDKAIEQYNDLVDEKNNPNMGFPQSCSSGEIKKSKNDFVKNIRTIITQCKTVSRNYDILLEKCSMKSFPGNCDKIKEEDYSKRWDDFTQYCRYDAKDDSKVKWCEKNKDKCDGGKPLAEYQQAWQDAWDRELAKTYTQEDWSADKTTMSDEIKGKTGGSTDYFAAIIRTEKDENGNINIIDGSQENVQSSVYQGMAENKTF